MASTTTVLMYIVTIIIAFISQVPPTRVQGEFLEVNDIVESGKNIVEAFENRTKTWEDFLTKHNRSYTAKELVERLALFNKALDAIETHNKQYNKNDTTYWLALNEFADWTTEEKASLTGTKISTTPSSESRKKRAVSLDSLCKSLTLQRSVDWRKNGSVTAVKNQRRCGSCWAFSVAGSLEGQRQKITNDSIQLSEQQLVDCDTNNSGCNGGDPASAFAYLQQRGGIMTAHSYPYTSSKGSCTFNKSEVAATVEGYNFVRPFKDECALKKTVAEVGPISMAAHVTDNFYYYGGGVYTDNTCKNDISSLNHAMLVVGYGMDGDTGYWIIKNSWGTGWGEDGYIRIISDGSNQCGVATYALYPVATAKNVTDARDASSFNRPALFYTFLCFIMSVAYFW